MCGFAGFRLLKNDLPVTPAELLQAMGDRLRHRGPDGEGQWFDQGTGLGLCHRRLAIQDVSTCGAQPMTSASGRYLIVFNGEVYNFMELREALPDKTVTFQGHSDTEVMLACFDRWGVRAAIERFEGMFAFALFDRQENTLYLARDRMGEKPLYYGWHRQQTLIFGSELKALRCHPHFDDTIDRDALALLLRHNYIPAPHSIYRSVQKLQPGCLLSVRLDEAQPAPVIERYWSLPDICMRPVHEASREDTRSELESLFERSVRQQMIADVPLGAFLSGGVDSSAVVAMMQSVSSQPVKTFSIGFHEPEYNEAAHAAAVARHLGADHTELYVHADDGRDVITSLPEIYDEPFADSSQIPTWLVSRLAREHVTVALSGDGGDELFCGYDRYFDYVRGWRRQQTSGIPRVLERMLLRGIPHTVLAPLAKFLVTGQHGLSTAHVREKLLARSGLLAADTLESYYKCRISYWHDPERIVIGAGEADARPAMARLPSDDYRKLMLLDSLSYLPDDILVKVDRAAMANSLETRIPLLNHKLVEFAAQMPVGYLTDGVTGKHILRDILYRHVPKALIERPKMGFAVPVAEWLRGPLREWSGDLLNSERLVAQGYLDAGIINRVWREHVDGHADHSFRLWGVLSFQAWLDHNMQEAGSVH
jgi:asparagine synthase (glutamine-hydrolysing)